MAAPGDVEFFFRYYHALLGLNNRTIQLITDRFIKTVGHAPPYFKIKEFATTLTLPGLIIHDKEDTETPYENAVAIHDAWKNSTLLTTTGLGHNLKSKELVAQVVQYLAK
ncbi:MAG: alpha/beta hydrolase [Flammeovirgaceae bacterium]